MTDGLPAPLIVDLDEVKRARREIDPAFTNSPLFESAALSKQYGGRVILKLETANPIGSFKGRGGDWLARTADHERPLACASAGNLGQGLAYGARRAGIPLHVFASRSANPLKLARIKDLGASLHLVDGDFDHAKNCAADQAAKEDWRLIVDGEDRRLAEGAATIAAEITDAFADTIDLIFVPVGNGSLACGVATWFKQHSQRTRIVGVSSTVAPATYNAWRSGVLEVGPSFTTIAEGLCARTPRRVPLRVFETRLTTSSSFPKFASCLPRPHCGVPMASSPSHPGPRRSQRLRVTPTCKAPR